MDATSAHCAGCGGPVAAHRLGPDDGEDPAVPPRRKGALTTTEDGRRYLYAPAVDRAAIAAGESRRLVDRLFGGRPAPLVAHLAERGELSSADIAELEALIRELKQ